MTTYSVAHAKDNLSRLIDLVLEGEGVVISRHGRPVVEMRAVQESPKIMTVAGLEQLSRARYQPTRPLADTAAALVSAMRDEGEH